MIEIVLFVLGLAIGSFANVLIDRLPRGETIWGRSHCEHCSHKLVWYELIPLVSWTVQMGRCRACQEPVSVQYPIIELGTAVGFVTLSILVGSHGLLLTSALVLFSAFLVIFVADLKYQIIPDSMLIALAIGVALLWATPLRAGTTPFPYLATGLIACAFFYIIWRVSGGKAMGFGDVKLSFVLGLLLGFPRTIVALYIAFLTGAIVGVILILVHTARLKSKIAFGPFLIFGTGVALMFGNDIMAWWNRFV
ncbi:prepilin peptidase [Candidatus Gottesmanbacteria bacterium]|nr:prepilin peptidase [Candidatus Gottesmanbacteria bacterium]